MTNEWIVVLLLLDYFDSSEKSFKYSSRKFLAFSLGKWAIKNLQIGRRNVHHHLCIYPFLIIQHSMKNLSMEKINPHWIVLLHPTNVLTLKHLMSVNTKFLLFDWNKYFSSRFYRWINVHRSFKHWSILHQHYYFNRYLNQNINDRIFH